MNSIRILKAWALIVFCFAFAQATPNELLKKQIEAKQKDPLAWKILVNKQIITLEIHKKMFQKTYNPCARTPLKEIQTYIKELNAGLHMFRTIRKKPQNYVNFLNNKSNVDLLRYLVKQ